MSGKVIGLMDGDAITVFTAWLKNRCRLLKITEEDWEEPYTPVACYPQAELIHELKDPAFK